MFNVLSPSLTALDTTGRSGSVFVHEERKRGGGGELWRGVFRKTAVVRKVEALYLKPE